MILGRLLTHLFTAGVVFVMTSNYRPDDLWPGGLNRERFLPTIALLRAMARCRRGDGDVDYRLRMLEQVESYYSPIDAGTDARLAAWFDRHGHRARRVRQAVDRRTPAGRAPARRQRRLVRFRDAVRRAALAARLSRAGAAVRHCVPLRRAADGAGHGATRRGGSPGSSTSCTITGSSCIVSAAVPAEELVH